MNARRRWLAGLVATALLGGIVPLAPMRTQQAVAQAQGSDLVIFAAASLKSALDAINVEWQKDTGRKATISYAASPALARQIEQGAPAQIFISADLDWMDYLATRNLIKADTRAKLLGNRIVLVAPRDAAQPIDIGTGFDLAKLLGDGRLSMANVDSVPAGKYGKAALEKLGAWPAVAGRIAQAENVRAALLLVSRGEASLGVVYKTDAAADTSVKVVGEFPETAHPPIIYPMAATSAASHPDVAAFLRYLASDKARPLFEAQGFAMLAPRPS